ncbi:hypothetical protein MKZ38_001249 [Zalerion maritima]|uniref:DNA repair protein RAD16 n=1 Tax=Zalerion maritima TaxID=339359 RepID=A0AAD5RY89_9PEZI|nr:hypothetical protein MKZ38_001249 [Zalerion maritima]
MVGKAVRRLSKSRSSIQLRQTADQTPAAPRRGRGRPRKSEPVLSAAPSSAATSNGISSESEYSTPATSAVPTPAPDTVKSSSIEMPNNSGSSRYSLRQSIAKRKREQSDSEDEELSQAVSRMNNSRWASKKTRTHRKPKNDDDEYMEGDDPDVALAQRLQDEEYKMASPNRGRRRSRPSLGGARSTKPAVVQDSAEDESLDEDENSPEDDLENEMSPDPIMIPDDDDFDAPLTLESSGSDSDTVYSLQQKYQRRSQLPRDLGHPHRKKGKQPTLQQMLEEHNVQYSPVFSSRRRDQRDLFHLIKHHPSFISMWQDLKNMPNLQDTAGKITQPSTISRQLKNFQLEGVAWMRAMEDTEWNGGLLGDEMGLGKTIQAVSLIMSDFPQKQPTLVLVPPVALMQWVSEIKSYTDGSLSTFILHGTNAKAKNVTAKELKKFDIIMMSYNSLESMYRKQEKGYKRKDGIHMEKSVIHQLNFHRIILDEAHCIKTRTTMTARACFALKSKYRWCLSGTPLQNRIGEFFSLVRFLNVRPFALYMCKKCPCEALEWKINETSRCLSCKCSAVEHVSVFNQQLLNPIQRHGRFGPGKMAFERLRLLSEKIMLRRQKKDHMNAMELPVKEIRVERQYFGEEESDFASSIMSNNQRKFDTYVAQGVVLNNYANIFGLIMQMRQVADHPDLILKRSGEGGQNVIVCCICDETAEEAVRSKCRHDFCRECAKHYVNSSPEPDCPVCHIPLSIDLEQPEMEQDEAFVKKSSIINRIKMENWTSSTKIELLVHEIWKLRSNHATRKSIVFSQFTTMLQLIEWRLRRAGITTVMLDGSMSPAQRQASIDHFMNNINVECFLVSLRAGGVALNLTEASRVFIVDPWWNPAAEWQSADRCHRIGQTRPCIVTRLCIEDSVESRMVLLQEKKTKMIHSTINRDDTAMDSLTEADLQFLFRGS